LAARTMRREGRARIVLFDPYSGGALFVCRILKRLDRFGLLWFEEASELPLGIALLAEDGSAIQRSAAFADIVSALPLGPCVAWMLRAPGLRGAWDALFAWLEGRDLSHFFGLSRGRSVTLPGPSAVHRGVGLLGAGLREAGILVMFAATANQAAVDLWVIRE